jgi:hypothetical protein
MVGIKRGLIPVRPAGWRMVTSHNSRVCTWQVTYMSYLKPLNTKSICSSESVRCHLARETQECRRGSAQTLLAKCGRSVLQWLWRLFGRHRKDRRLAGLEVTSVADVYGVYLAGIVKI